MLSVLIVLLVLSLAPLARAGESLTCQVVQRTGTRYSATWRSPDGRTTRTVEIPAGLYEATRERGEPPRPGLVPADWAYVGASGRPTYNTPSSFMGVGDIELFDEGLEILVPTQLRYALPNPPYSVSGPRAKPTLSPDPPGLTCHAGVLTITDPEGLPQ